MGLNVYTHVHIYIYMHIHINTHMYIYMYMEPTLEPQVHMNRTYFGLFEARGRVFLSSSGLMIPQFGRVRMQSIPGHGIIGQDRSTVLRL